MRWNVHGCCLDSHTHWRCWLWNSSCSSTAVHESCSRRTMLYHRILRIYRSDLLAFRPIALSLVPWSWSNVSLQRYSLVYERLGYWWAEFINRAHSFYRVHIFSRTMQPFHSPRCVAETTVSVIEPYDVSFRQLFTMYYHLWRQSKFNHMVTFCMSFNVSFNCVEGKNDVDACSIGTFVPQSCLCSAVVAYDFSGCLNCIVNASGPNNTIYSAAMTLASGKDFITSYPSMVWFVNIWSIQSKLLVL